MKSSLKKINRIKDILDIDGEILTYKFDSLEVKLDLGEEQLNRIFNKFIKRNIKDIKERLSEEKLVKCQSGLGISCLFILNEDNPKEYFLLTPFLDYLISTKDFQESLIKYGATVNEEVRRIFFSLPILQRKKFNYLVELIAETEEIDYLNEIALIEDVSIKNIKRTVTRKSTYLNNLLEYDIKFNTELLDAVASGNISRVNMLYDLRNQTLKVMDIEKGEDSIRRNAYSLNDLLRYALETKSKDYLEVEELWVRIKNKLDNYDLSENIVRSYCLLIDKNKYKDKQAVVRNCISYINDRITEKVSLDNISDYLGVNKSYLSSIFNKDMGISIVDYIHDKRISNARYLLKNTDFSISEIADYIGYFDTSYFIRIFKTITKVTPLKYRENLSSR